MNFMDADDNAINLEPIAIDSSDGYDSIIADATGKIIQPSIGNDYTFNEGSYITIIGDAGIKTIALLGDKNVISLGNGINIAIISGSGSTVKPDDSSGNNSNIIINGDNLDGADSGFDIEKLKEAMQLKEEDWKTIVNALKNDPIFKDISEKGANSEYLLDFDSKDAVLIARLVPYSVTR